MFLFVINNRLGQKDLLFTGIQTQKETFNPKNKYLDGQIVISDNLHNVHLNLSYPIGNIYTGLVKNYGKIFKVSNICKIFHIFQVSTPQLKFTTNRKIKVSGHS